MWSVLAFNQICLQGWLLDQILFVQITNSISPNFQSYFSKHVVSFWRPDLAAQRLAAWLLEQTPLNRFHIPGPSIPTIQYNAIQPIHPALNTYPPRHCHSSLTKDKQSHLQTHICASLIASSGNLEVSREAPYQRNPDSSLDIFRQPQGTVSVLVHFPI